MEFDAVLQANGKTATGLAVPPKVVEQLGDGTRALVTITINGHTYASAIGSMDGKAMLPVSAEHRLKAGSIAGDRVTVVIALVRRRRRPASAGSRRPLPSSRNEPGRSMTAR
jgi:hypothetical protein